MRIVLITGDGLGHRYVANRLAAETRLEGIVVDHGKKISAVGRMRQLWIRYTIRQLLSRACLAFFQAIWKDEDVREQSLLSVFGRENCADFLRADIVHHVHGINTAEGVSAVSSLEPDVILVFGTGVVGSKILSLAKKIALNMHTGISPYYRGCDCAFWPLYNEDLDMLGATVHECTKDIDGGRIFGTTRVVLKAEDGAFTVFARCIAAGADLYVEKVRELMDQDLTGTTQDLSLGTEYKAYMKGLRAELKVRSSIKAGLIRRFLETRRAAMVHSTISGV